MTAHPWSLLTRTPLPDRDVVSADGIGGLDQTLAFVRNAFDELAVPLTNPENVYAALATLDVAIRTAVAAARNDLITGQGAEDAVAVVRALELAVGCFAPAEAKTS